MRGISGLLVLITFLSGCKSNDQDIPQDISDAASYREQYRPQVHFSPQANWMNDPNGMVYHKGQYHFFYQHHPNGTKWGPMHWGHAVSKDLVNWQHLPIALYPDSLGLIFSGSVVFDKENSSGLGTAQNPPLVAIFTYHSQQLEEAGRTDYQCQGMAYSLDDGKTWEKYERNPVLKNQGIKDFRDPKVFWHHESKKWVMILAVKDHVELWGSPDLKAWNKLSDFGIEHGAHGGVWECPDLFYSKIEGEDQGRWVMIVSMNPGGPNGGSATQYFIGEFEGTTFRSHMNKNSIAWLDYGPDNYAGVTFSNAPDNRRIFIGWMNNWAYAQDLPTSTWRGAATMPREILLTRVGDLLLLRSVLSPDVENLVNTIQSSEKILVADSVVVNPGIDCSKSLVSATVEAQDFSFELFNQIGQKIILGFDKKNNQFFIERGLAGKKDFSASFNSALVAPRLSVDSKIKVSFVADASSIEVFFDDGLTTMTSLYFPDEPLKRMQIKASGALSVEKFDVKQLETIWK